MRRILYVYLLLVCGGGLSLTSAQPLDYSYVRSRVMTDAAGTGYMEHTDYDNGLGQLFQQVDAGISPTHKDLVTLYEYDGFRRQTHQWLPAPLSGSGSWQSPNTVKSAVSQAMSDTSPYTETSYEQNPLERMSERSLPGAAWRQSQRKMTFSRFLSRNSNLGGNAIGFAGYYNYVFFNYSDDKSMVESVIDEDGTTIQTYRDLDGNVCAVRKLSGAETLETDYAYDIWGNLRYVLPPEASSYYQANHAYGPSSGDAVFQQFVYEYRYDGRHNCIYKKLPGCDPVYYVYDKADRCILSQDGAQRAKGQWSYTIPDVFGRPVMTGVCHNTLTYTALPLSNTVVCAARSSSGSCGYTVSGITLSSDTVYTVTYYDDYAFIGSNGVPSSLTYAAPPSGGYGIQGISAPRGLATGSVTARVTSTGVTGYDYAAMYYDDRGRMVQTRSTNHLGGCDCVYTGYDFTGKVLRECHTPL